MAWLICCCVLGYLAGGVLWANVFGGLFHKDVTGEADDHNPGTFNAFAYGGFLCGVLTLLCDLLKGFLPVFLYLRWAGPNAAEWGVIPVLLAPVAGHLYPLFYGFRGGKGIAVSFGALLGLLPWLLPAAIPAAVFVVLSTVARVDPNAARTLWTYRLSAVLAAVLIRDADCYVLVAFLLMTLLINGHMRFTCGEKENGRVKWLWTR